MTRAGRALLGAAIGAAITLLFHPISRPYPLSAFLTPHFQRPSPSTSSLSAISDWMLAVGDRFIDRNPLKPIEMTNAIDAAKHGVELDPDNAYWHQMLASLYHQAGHEVEARKEWTVASVCAKWNDYQSTQLLRSREQMATAFGAPQSWQLAYAYYQRDESAVQYIMSYGRSILATTRLESEDGLTLRARNVLNGSRIQQQGRSIRIGRLGGQMMEAASHGPGIATTGSFHKLTLARMDLMNKLRAADQAQLADQVNRAYRESDAWNAYENPEDAANQVSTMSLWSLIYVGFPAMMVVTGVLGLGLWLLGRSFRRVEHIEIVPAAIGGMAIAVIAYVTTLLPLAAVVTLSCCLLLTLGPKRERKVRIDDLGPMFGFTVIAVGIAFMALVGIFVVGASTPATAVLPWLGAPRDYYGGSGVFLGLALIVLSMLALLAPMFAVALRVGTSFVLSMALRRLGAFLGFFSLVGIVIGTPLCIYFDRQNGSALARIVGNEPVYYLSLPR